MMKKDAKIYVAGHRGMVGSAIVRELQRQGYTNLVTRTHAELDLCRQVEVENFFAEEKPEYVFFAAAKIGGILAHQEYPAIFLYTNAMIEFNILHSAFQTKCKKVLYIGSIHVYPKDSFQPMRESDFYMGELEKSNESYAFAKIAGLKYCEYLNKQRGTEYISLLPTNLYGINDNYHEDYSCVVPALIRRLHEAKISGKPYVTCWGDGSVIRDFLYVDDLANLSIFLMNTYSESEAVNAGTGKGISIADLTKLIAKIVNYSGEVRWDTSKPNGMPRKLLDVSKAAALGWAYKTKLEEGIRLTYEDFLHNPIRAER